MAVPAHAQLLSRRAARVRTDAVELAAGPPRPARRPGHGARAAAALRTLLDDLAPLPELQRHALLRRELDGVSHDELASELGVTSGATRSLVHRARAALTRAAEGRRSAAPTSARTSSTPTIAAAGRPPARSGTSPACHACRSLQSALRAQRRKLAVLTPPAGLLALLGVGALNAGCHAEGDDVASTLVVAAGVSVELFEAGGPPRSRCVPRAARATRSPPGRRSRPARRSCAATVPFPEQRSVALGCPTACASRTCCRRTADGSARTTRARRSAPSRPAGRPDGCGGRRA